MHRTPIAFNGHSGQMRRAPGNKYQKQSGGGEWNSTNAHSQISAAPLPCGCYEKAKYQPNRPTCAMWNTNSCNYSLRDSQCGQCGTCAGSNPCNNYPYSYATTTDLFQPAGPAPVCNMALDKVRGQFPPQKPEMKGGNQQDPCKSCGNNPIAPASANYYFSQQCQCKFGGDCAGSSSAGFGCGCKCPGQKGAGSGCSDCQHYYRQYQTYRHMLKGSLYPFC